MDEDEKRKPLIIFGRDVSMIPCFRKSFLTGFGCGITSGLATFMFTSKPSLASHMSVATFVCSTMSYWFYCRYNWSKEKLEAAKLLMLLERHAVLQGTPMEKQIDDSTSLPLLDV